MDLGGNPHALLLKSFNSFKTLVGRTMPEQFLRSLRVNPATPDLKMAWKVRHIAEARSPTLLHFSYFLGNQWNQRNSSLFRLALGLCHEEVPIIGGFQPSRG